MAAPNPTEILNRVLAMLTRSFVQYMRYSRPYIPFGRERTMDTIEDIGNAQDALARCVDELVDESGATPDSGDFPMEFTDTHDLGVDFLIAEAIGYQKQDIAELAQHVEALKFAPAAQSLASEALGMAKGHLELLEGLSPKADGSAVIPVGA